MNNQERIQRKSDRYQKITPRVYPSKDHYTKEDSLWTKIALTIANIFAFVVIVLLIWIAALD